MATSGCHDMMDFFGHDVIYAPFPLYHTVGIVLGVGQSVIFGCQVVLRHKFSASNFWKDCAHYNVTV